MNQMSVGIVAPCYNEAYCIAEFVKTIRKVFDEMPEYRLEIIFVNDGSQDNTLEEMLKCQAEFSNIRIIDFSRNFGKEAAVTAGLDNVDCDCVIPMDADLQHPPSAIPHMLEKWREGFDVVLARRKDRPGESWGKRLGARIFYAMHNCCSNPKLPDGVGDFRLMDKKVVLAFRTLPERCRFLKGIFAWLGFRVATIEFRTPQRFAGKSKFNFWKLWNFALDGITSFSTMPLRLWTYVGLFFAALAFIYGNVIFWRTIIFGVDLPGYASLLVAVTFLGGLQLIGIGVLGEYLGRTYFEAKGRPIYIIRHIYTGIKKLDE